MAKIISAAGFCQQRLWVNSEQVPIHKIVGEIPESDWVRHSIGDGSKGKQVYDWISWPVRKKDESGFQRYVLSRRSVSNPGEYAYYFCYAHENRLTEVLAEAFGKWWNIECCFETAKQETCLDEYEIRSWHGWYGHITLSMLALAYLSALHASCQNDEAEKKELNLQNEKSNDF